MKRDMYNAIYYSVLGIALIIMSMFAIVMQERFLMRVFDLLGWILIINGFHQLATFVRNHYKGELINVFINIGVGIFLNVYTGIPVRLVLMIFSLYVIINGIVKLIAYLNYKKDKVGNRLPVLCIAVILIDTGVSLLLGKSTNANGMMLFIGCYGLLLGCMYIVDGVGVVIPKRKKDMLKRHIRIPVPVFIAALIPKIMMDYINDHLSIETKDNNNQVSNIEIFIHVSPDGFGTVGHCDICIDGNVISYGNYDYDSIRLFEAIGDGVIFIAPRDSYIPFCIETSNKTIFSYGVAINKEQQESIKKEIQKIFSNTYQWYPHSYDDPNNAEDYASRLYLKTHAQFYKFKKGKFKTYFVMGSNCVKLAETIMSKSGMDIIDLNGVISPGSYQDYLEKEYQRMQGRIISKKIYNQYQANLKMSQK